MHEAVRGFITVVKMDADTVDLNVAVLDLESDGTRGFGTAVSGDAVMVGGFVDMGFTEVRPIAVFLGGKGAGNGKYGEKSKEHGAQRGSHRASGGGSHEGLRTVLHFNPEVWK